MRVGIVGGTGPLGRGLGLRLAAGGSTVVIGSRQAERAEAVVSELCDRWSQHHLPVEGAANEEAVACDVVVVATPWDSLVPTVRLLARDVPRCWDDKVVICVANALVKQGREMHALVPPRGSMAAAVQAELPQALVAAAGHHLPARELENLDAPLRSDVLVCSDQVVAIRTTMSLVATIPGLRPLDAGSLASAGAIEAFTAVLVNVNIRYKAHSSLLLTGLDHLVSPNDPSSRDASLRVGSADGLQRSSASETLGKG